MDPKRIEAARAGLPFYTAADCKVHGRALRYVSNGKCCECMKARARAQYEAEAKELREAREAAA